MLQYRVQNTCLPHPLFLQPLFIHDTSVCEPVTHPGKQDHMNNKCGQDPFLFLLRSLFLSCIIINACVTSCSGHLPPSCWLSSPLTSFELIHAYYFDMDNHFAKRSNFPGSLARFPATICHQNIIIFIQCSSRCI